MLKVSGKLYDLFRVNEKSISDYIIGSDYKVLCNFQISNHVVLRLWIWYTNKI